MKKGLCTKLCYLLLLSGIIFMMSSCATTKPSALRPDISSVDVTKESIVLLTVKIANEYKTGYQPDIKSVFISTADKNDSKNYSFSVDEKFNEVKDSYNEYLLSCQLPPGEYKIREIYARSGLFPVIGNFYAPVFSSFSLEPNKIIYLGHIDATVKERKDENSLTAGPPIPLIDQAVTGASGGTFDIKITDKFENDIKLFQQKYPYIAKHNVDNQTLPQWVQPNKEDM